MGTGCGCEGCPVQNYLDEGHTCESLQSHGLDTSDCDCTPKCSDTCKEYLGQGFTCEQLAGYDMDCSACDCTPKCTDNCKNFLTHYSCGKLKNEYGMDCSGCGECSCSHVANIFLLTLVIV